MKPNDKAKSVRQKLANLSRKTGINYKSIETAFLIERLVARIVIEEDVSKKLIFKGGYVAMRIYNSDRYTIDIDAISRQSNFDELIEKIARSSSAPLNDGTEFVFQSKSEIITQGTFKGIRLHFRGGIMSSQSNKTIYQKIHFDIGVSDKIVPEAIFTKTPELIGDGTLSWHVYPKETICAEKIHALVSLGDNNSRSKDIFDLSIFLPSVDRESLLRSIEHCFKTRQTKFPVRFLDFVQEIDLTMLRRGWKNAVNAVPTPPTFDEAFSVVLAELKKIFKKN